MDRMTLKLKTEPKKVPAAIVLVDGSYGIYIPQRFRALCDMDAWHVRPEDADVLHDGPENEHYWDAWDRVTDEAWWMDGDGNKRVLLADADLFAVLADDPWAMYDEPADCDAYLDPTTIAYNSGREEGLLLAVDAQTTACLVVLLGCLHNQRDRTDFRTEPRTAGLIDGMVGRIQSVLARVGRSQERSDG